MTDPTEYPGMDAPLVERLAWARHAGVMSLFAKKALEDAETVLREQGGVTPSILIAGEFQDQRPSVPTREQIADAIATVDAPWLAGRDYLRPTVQNYAAADAVLALIHNGGDR